MTAPTVALERPDTPEALALVEALDAFQRPLYPAESHHGIDTAALLAPGVRFAVARDAAGAAIGCGAVVLHAGWAEIKRMFVVPAARGGGAAAALLARLAAEAQAQGARRLLLETGIHQPAALAFYGRAGFVRRGPFAGYGPDPLSVFMEKPLDDATVRVRSHGRGAIPQADAAAVDAGLGAFNAAAAPLHDSRELACFAHAADGRLLGGAIGRTWGRCAELQQLWVGEAERGQGIARRLVLAFHAAAEARGCSTFYLETFSFQAVGFYRGLGYADRLVVEGFAPGVAKHWMVREVPAAKGLP